MSLNTEKIKDLSNYEKVRFAVAPMIDWTDRHCRYFHRLFSQNALLYTEMIVADAIIHGPRDALLGFDNAEHPIALQLGGSDPAKLAEAARVAVDYGYDEINLNVGCPSDRVQSGSFGACLMLTPEIVARCVAAMKAAVDIPVTVKCRIGVDDQDTQQALDILADLVIAEGVSTLWVHARKAWLQGLSPKENREIPPLDYDRVYRLKQRLNDVYIGLNGGIDNINDALDHLKYVDGVMLGRAAYHNPALLGLVDKEIYGQELPQKNEAEIIDAMCEYSEKHIANGGRLSHITRHMVGMFSGGPGARRFRQILSTEATRYGADSSVLRSAYEEVLKARGAAAEYALASAL